MTERRPEWLRKEKPFTAGVVNRKAEIARLGLHTVCESARCPNLSECYQAGTATFLILGEQCTRNCGFCAVEHGPCTEPDPGEGKRIARHMAEGAVRYAVITSVTRDDLPDGGASHFARVVGDIRASLPAVGLELLTPDFQGRQESVATVAALPIEVFGHNLETVASLYPTARRGADYARSLAVLAQARAISRARIKTGVMVGLGESAEELARLFDDCAAAGVSILTIGQYLRPGWGNLPVARYVRPDEFERLALEAKRRGIPVVQAGPYVRSSYLAERVCREGEAAQRPSR
jgi:lipoic acid synthetase